MMFPSCNKNDVDKTSIKQLKRLSSKVKSEVVSGYSYSIDQKVKEQYLDYDDFEIHSEYVNVTGEVNLVQKVNLRKGQYRVGWMLNSETSECLLCGDQFGLLYPRRHHCRLCGGIFCYKCSSLRLQLSELKEEYLSGSRSCLRCFSEICKVKEKVKEQQHDDSNDNIDINNNNHYYYKEQEHNINSNEQEKEHNNNNINETRNENSNPNISIDDDISNDITIKTPLPSDSIMMSILRITRNEGLWEYDDTNEGTPASSLSVLTPISTSRSPYNSRLTPLKIH